MSTIAASGQVRGSLARPEAEHVRFDSLSAESIAEARKDTHAFVLARLLEEAKKRGLEADLIRYVEASFRVWQEEVRKTEETAFPGPENTATRNALMSERHFASCLDDGAPFGQFMFLDSRVLQVVDEMSLLVYVRRVGSDKENLVWVSGVDTSGIADGAELPLGFFLERLWRVAGTKSYTGGLGTRQTVPHIARHPLDMKKALREIDLFHFGLHVQAVEKAIAQQDEAAAQEKERMARTRTWSDASGSFRLEAEFLGYSNGVV